MISVVDVDGKLFCKTKKSFYSTVAIAAQKYFDTQPNLQELAKYLINGGYTPTFEYESPENQIVIPQTEEKMTLLLARNIATGEYLHYPLLLSISDLYKVPTPRFASVTNITNLISLAKQATNIEGWVIWLPYK